MYHPPCGKDASLIEKARLRRTGKLPLAASTWKGWNHLRKVLVLSALAATFIVPAGAQSATGMAAMQYYVGTWSCVGKQTGQAATNATLTYSVDSGVLREWVNVPAQGKMKQPYVISIATTYDAKNGRYVQTGLDSTAAWWVSYAKPWAGNTEQWADHANSTGKLGRSQTVRNDQNSFTFIGYETIASMKPNFKATCHRSM